MTVAVRGINVGEQATPVISVDNSNGLITATAGTKSSTYQMAFQPAQTITPGTTSKTIAANTYLGGTQTIKGDTNLVASNIVSGKSIFGVTGTATAAEDLDAELTAQEGLIQQLSTILDSKASGGSSGSKMVSVTINSSFVLFYWDANGQIKTATSGTVSALNGLIISTGSGYQLTAVGDYIKGSYGAIQSLIFNSDGGTAKGTLISGGGAE
jgi:hypothetical protein